MTLSEFLKRFLYHITASALVLTAILLLDEKLVPGLVLPFIDVIDFLPILLGLLILTLFTLPDEFKS